MAENLKKNINIMKDLISQQIINIPQPLPTSGTPFWSFFYSKNSTSQITSVKESENKKTNSKQNKADSLFSLFAPYSPESSFISILEAPPKPPDHPSIKTIKPKAKGPPIHIYCRTVHLSNTTFFKTIFKFKLLTSLSLSNCSISVIPQELMKLPPSIKRLDLSNNQISELPETIRWSDLNGLFLNGNSFSSWPTVLSGENFPNLTNLSFADNFIQDINITPFPQLKGLNLSYCGLPYFPPWISSCSTLEILKLNGNSFAIFSTSFIAPLSNLKILNISGLNTSPAVSELSDNIQVIIARGKCAQNIPNGMYALIV